MDWRLVPFGVYVCVYKNNQTVTGWRATKLNGNQRACNEITLIYWWTNSLIASYVYGFIYEYCCSRTHTHTHACVCLCVLNFKKKKKTTATAMREKKKTHEQIQCDDVKFEYQTKFVLLPAFYSLMGPVYIICM